MNTAPEQDPRGTGLVRRFVTIRAVHSNEQIDLEMPADRPLADIMADLLKVLEWPATEDGDPLTYQLRTEAGEVLDQSTTLESAGIENADLLWIGIAEGTELEANTGKPAASEPALRTEAAEAAKTEPRLQARESSSPLGGSLTPPVPAHFRTEVPSLVSKRGYIFELGKPPLLIGRTSRTSSPDIDLTDVDPELASSRRHARISINRQRYLLEAFPTTNGTFVNGREVKPGEPHPLSTGDRVQFGVEGVELVFLLSGESVPASFFEAS